MSEDRARSADSSQINTTSQMLELPATNPSPSPSPEPDRANPYAGTAEDSDTPYAGTADKGDTAHAGTADVETYGPLLVKPETKPTTTDDAAASSQAGTPASSENQSGPLSEPNVPFVYGAAPPAPAPYLYYRAPFVGPPTVSSGYVNYYRAPLFSPPMVQSGSVNVQPGLPYRNPPRRYLPMQPSRLPIPHAKNGE